MPTTTKTTRISANSPSLKVTVNAQKVIIENEGSNSVTFSNGSGATRHLTAKRRTDSELHKIIYESPNSRINEIYTFTFGLPSTVLVTEIIDEGSGGSGGSEDAANHFDLVVRLEGRNATEFATPHVPAHPSNETYSAGTAGRKYVINSGDKRKALSWRFLDASKNNGRLTINGIEYTTKDGGYAHAVTGTGFYSHQMEFEASGDSFIEILIQKVDS